MLCPPRLCQMQSLSASLLFLRTSNSSRPNSFHSPKHTTPSSILAPAFLLPKPPLPVLFTNAFLADSSLSLRTQLRRQPLLKAFLKLHTLPLGTHSPQACHWTSGVSLMASGAPEGPGSSMTLLFSPGPAQARWCDGEMAGGLGMGQNISF